MAAPWKVATLVGSLRAASLNRRTARAIAALAPDSLTFDEIEIGTLPAYNEDREQDAPADWTEFRGRVGGADAVLFVTPEYNRSVPGVLKNAIDVGSRPYGKSVWSRKPAAVVSVSPGGIGGFGANHHLRQSLVFLDMPVLQQPEAYIGHAGDLFGEDAAVKNEGTEKFLRSFGEAFAAWIALFKR
jgi:chromate reductase, NAD(P)H dehydrogenase (quinone)